MIRAMFDVDVWKRERLGQIMKCPSGQSGNISILSRGGRSGNCRVHTRTQMETNTRDKDTEAHSHIFMNTAQINRHKYKETHADINRHTETQIHRYTHINAHVHGHRWTQTQIDQHWCTKKLIVFRNRHKHICIYTTIYICIYTGFSFSAPWDVRTGYQQFYALWAFLFHSNIYIHNMQRHCL